jgi:hypothetical protein
MSLGDKLKTTMDALNEARVAHDAAIEQAALAKLEADKKKRQKFVDLLTHDITSDIEDGRVPRCKINNYDDQAWIRRAQRGNAPFQKIWSDFIKALGHEKLSVNVIEAHDGVGVNSWLVISVTPSKHKIVYRGRQRVPTPDERLMDPRPATDPRIVDDN